MKTNTFATMLGFYHTHAYTDRYIFGILFKGTLYMIKADASSLGMLLKLDKASRGKGYSLRFRPNRQQKALLMSMGATPLCSAEMFAELVAESKYNKGEVFEKLVTEYFGQTWEKDNVPFTEDGDLTVNGIAYQIKFEQATFITEAQMLRMRAEA